MHHLNSSNIDPFSKHLGCVAIQSSNCQAGVLLPVYVEPKILSIDMATNPSQKWIPSSISREGYALVLHREVAVDPITSYPRKRQYISQGPCNHFDLCIRGNQELLQFSTDQMIHIDNKLGLLGAVRAGNVLRTLPWRCYLVFGIEQHQPTSFCKMIQRGTLSVASNISPGDRFHIFFHWAPSTI